MTTDWDHTDDLSVNEPLMFSNSVHISCMCIFAYSVLLLQPVSKLSFFAPLLGVKSANSCGTENREYASKKSYLYPQS